MDMAQKIKDRDEAILSLDKEKILAYDRKYGIEVDEPDELIFWAGVHKTVTALRSATEEQKAYSRIWLYPHGFRETFG